MGEGDLAEPPVLVELDRPPILPVLLAKAAVAPRGRGGALPSRGLRRSGIPVDAARAGRYARLCGFPVRDQVPPTYPHLLAFPLQVAYLTGRDFPLSLPGLVHIGNEITAARPIDPAATVDVEVWGDGLRGHRSGTAVDVHARLLLDGDPVWHGRSTYLARRRRSTSTPADPATAQDGVSPGQGRDPRPGGQVAATWVLPADAGRRYALLSGDINPIHLHAATARLFGLRAPIAHGMYTHARSVAALVPRLPGQVRLQARFHAPVTLPQRVDLYLRPGAADWQADLTAHGADRVLMSTTASSLPRG